MESGKESSFEKLSDEQWQAVSQLLKTTVEGFKGADDSSLRELWSVMIPSNRATFLRTATDPEFRDQLKKIKKTPEVE